MNRLDGKVAMVTGGALGIVAVTDILSDEGRQVSEEIRSQGGSAQFWELDVTSEDAVKKVIDEVQKHFGGLHVLVNNAGIAGADRPTHELSLEDWDRVFNVNVKGVFLCTKYAIPHMRRSGSGSIINLSSIYGIIGAPDIPPYHASKGAVRLMTKTDALQYAKDKIRVNSVHPGYIWTPLVEGIAKRSPQGVDEFRRHLDSLHPVGHVGEPDDIAYGVVYLASEEAKFVTGSELVIDGGYTSR
jgi:NAD(P)-dependent dehydrogenase (short-subunit alcohol dehydrogenase family)